MERRWRIAAADFGGDDAAYLSNLLHPSVGYLAGWASLLVGFSAPILLQGILAAVLVHTHELTRVLRRRP